ncbi:hypothetical protein [Raineyella sp. LH-20]|uniref:hypothetical protein n=1 Tax=Raineyella sp. LH-20 TaxID=3081204 RepID=UPI002953E92B|nr:hypothetical protein [Raineyella sp. LH-20]WOP17401.1 hypothetical protein R0146_08910 [Raineyella sp. LH-20]
MTTSPTVRIVTATGRPLSFDEAVVLAWGLQLVTEELTSAPGDPSPAARDVLEAARGLAALVDANGLVVLEDVLEDTDTDTEEVER